MKNYFIISILIFILIEILNNYSILKNSIMYATKLWINNIFPTLLPFFIISSLLIAYGFVEIIGNILYPITNKLFNISKSATFVLFMSLFSGIPSNAKYIVELYNKNEIDEKEGTNLLCYTFFSNPLFIIGTLAATFLNSEHLAPIILFSHYIPNILIGIYLKKHNTNYNNNISKRISNPNFGKVVTNSIMNAINTLLLILGVITFFSILTTIITNKFNINSTFVSSIFEITQGLNNIKDLNISLKLKTILSTMVLSFGGLSSHMQIYSIISETNIKYKPFLISRIVHSLLSGLFIYLLF